MLNRSERLFSAADQAEVLPGGVGMFLAEAEDTITAH